MIYVNDNTKSAIMSLEFAPSVGSNYSFIHVRKTAGPLEIEEVKKKITDFGGVITAESMLEGSPIFVVRGPKTQYEMLSAFNESGEKLKAPEQGSSLTPWKMRGYASIIGQGGQIMSSLLNAKGLDGATMTFASLNMIANITNIVFGGETKKDDNRLIHLKREFNKKLREYIPADVSPPSSYDKRLKIRHDEPPPPDLASRAYNFIKHHSVTFCEIGLRYIGSIALVLPFANLKGGVRAFSDEIIKHKAVTGAKVASLERLAAEAKGKGGKEAEIAEKVLLKEAKHVNTLGLSKALVAGLKAAKNTDKWTLGVGATYIVGKSIGLMSKVPDPYDPKPHTWIDTLREKITFRLSSLIEFGAATILVYDRLVRKVTDKKTGEIVNARTTDYKKMGNFFESVARNFVKETPQWIESLKKAKTRDWFGGVGGALFAGGFLVRLFAPFGSKEVDMKELNAHITDSLAKVPGEKLPQVLAEFSAKLAEEFKGTVEYGEVFRTLEEGLHRYHGISINYDSPEQGKLQSAVKQPDLQRREEDEMEMTGKNFAQQYAKKSSPAANTPPRSKAEQVLQSVTQDGGLRYI